MTETLARPAVRRAPPSVRGRSPWGPGLAGALWAAGAGLVAVAVPVLLVWAADGRSGADAPAALRLAAYIWLVANGADLSLPGTVFGLVPLGLAAGVFVLLGRAGGHCARTARPVGSGQAGQVIAAIALPYAALTGSVAALTAGHGVHPGLVRAVAGGAALGAAGSAWGALRGPTAEGRRPVTVPPSVRAWARAVAVAVGLVLTCGALVAGAALAWHASRAAELAHVSGPGLVGGVALFGLGLAAVPNAAVWGLAWLTGPGFAVGTGTAVGPFATHLGPVPAFPLFAALPAGPLPRPLAVAAVLVPVLAGVVAGRLLTRGRDGPRRGGHRAATLIGPAALVGPGAGAVVGLLCALSGGPLGSGRLASVGPSWWHVAAAVSVEMSCGAVLWTLGSALAVRHARSR